MLLALDARAVLVARTVADARLPALAELADLPGHRHAYASQCRADCGAKAGLVLQLSGRKEAQLQSEALRTLGVNVLTFEMDSFEQMFDVLAKIGLLTGREQKAAALIKDWRARLAALKARYAGQKPVRVFYEVRYPNLLAAGKVSIVNEIIACAGGENVVGEEKKLVRFNEEALIQADPDVYLLQKGPMNPDPRASGGGGRITKSCVPRAPAGSWWWMRIALPGPVHARWMRREELARWLHPQACF